MKINLFEKIGGRLYRKVCYFKNIIGLDECRSCKYYIETVLKYTKDSGVEWFVKCNYQSFNNKIEVVKKFIIEE